ncbi:acyltransferase [Sphingomonas aerolata]
MVKKHDRLVCRCPRQFSRYSCFAPPNRDKRWGNVYAACPGRRTLETSLCRIGWVEGVAALMVVAYHIGIFLKFPSGMTVHGNIAVDFFLCLSGFVLAFAHERRLRENGGELARFLMSRVVRLWPSVLAGSVAALLVALGMAGGPGASSAYRAFALSLVVLPRLEGQNLVWFNGVYWSLFAEILVNLLWAISVKALGNRRLIAIAFVLSVAITWIAIDHNSVHFFYQSVDMVVPTTVRALASFCMGGSHTGSTRRVA